MDTTPSSTACAPVALAWRCPRDAMARRLRCPRSAVAALQAQSRKHATLVHAHVVLPWRIELIVSPMRPGGLAVLRHLLEVAGVDPVLWTAPQVIASEDALWAWHRRIDTAPVRALLVDTADAYRWSSHGALAHGDRSALVVPHAAYMALGDDRPARRRAYRALVAGPPPAVGLPSPRMPLPGAAHAMASAPGHGDRAARP